MRFVPFKIFIQVVIQLVHLWTDQRSLACDNINYRSHSEIFVHVLTSGYNSLMPSPTKVIQGKYLIVRASVDIFAQFGQELPEPSLPLTFTRFLIFFPEYKLLTDISQWKEVFQLKQSQNAASKPESTNSVISCSIWIGIA